jgi:hypothetical protein
MKTSRLLIAILVVVTSAGMALAQRSAASKILGGGYNFYSGSTYSRHAREHAGVLNYYGQAGQPIPREVAREHSMAIRQNIESSRRAYSQLRQAVPDNKAAQQHLDTIEKHHQAALAMCDKLDAACAADSADHTAVCACCLDIHKELKAADQAAAKLHKELKLDEPTAPAAQR